jgi:hypothetical protein
LDKDFLVKVRSEGEKDEQYKKELDFSKTENEENVPNILHQEAGVLFRKLKLWEPTGLRAEICKGNTTCKLPARWAKIKPGRLLNIIFGGLA